ncbi:hypothetical protein JHU04_001792 [Brenneria sp. 4F2]|nr:hypothetical protein [Brenneria bubanii]
MMRWLLAFIMRCIRAGFQLLKIWRLLIVAIFTGLLQSPPLKIIHQPKDELGELAVDTLRYRLEQHTEANVLALTPELVVRNSVG